MAVKGSCCWVASIAGIGWHTRAYVSAASSSITLASSVNRAERRWASSAPRWWDVRATPSRSSERSRTPGIPSSRCIISSSRTAVTSAWCSTGKSLPVFRPRPTHPDRPFTPSKPPPVSTSSAPSCTATDRCACSASSVRRRTPEWWSTRSALAERTSPLSCAGKRVCGARRCASATLISSLLPTAPTRRWTRVARRPCTKHSCAQCCRAFGARSPPRAACCSRPSTCPRWPVIVYCRCWRYSAACRANLAVASGTATASWVGKARCAAGRQPGPRSRRLTTCT